MKVIKIDIISSLMEVKDGQDYIHFRKYNSGNFIKEDGDEYQQIHTTDEFYRVMRLHIPNEGIKNIAVKLDEEGVYNELIDMSNETITNLKEESKNIGYQMGLSAGNEKENYRIKQLPWYKRLFKKF